MLLFTKKLILGPSCVKVAPKDPAEALRVVKQADVDIAVDVTDPSYDAKAALKMLCRAGAGGRVVIIGDIEKYDEIFNRVEVIGIYPAQWGGTRPWYKTLTEALQATKSHA